MDVEILRATVPTYFWTTKLHTSGILGEAIILRVEMANVNMYLLTESYLHSG